MDIKKEFWSLTRNGERASRYILKNDNGMEAVLSDFGALISAIRLPVGGEMRDLVLGYDTLEEYYTPGPELGAYVGRNANRIAGAKVIIGGTEYTLDKNDGNNNLHSGFDRSHFQFYTAQTGVDSDSIWVEFSRLSPHLEQHFPGNLMQHIRYTLTNQDSLTITYNMHCDADTVINPTNHSFFNLAGCGNVLDHKMQVFANHFLPTDRELIPTGEIRPVAGTPMDFREAKRIGAEIDADYEPLIFAGGYDHCFCLETEKAARLISPDGDVEMTVFTDLPGLQVYSGNFLNGEIGKDGAVYTRRSGICFESQFYPNSCNEPRFATSICKAHIPFHSQTVYQFHWKTE